MKARKLSQLIKDLNQIKDEQGDLPLCYAADDEGNSFHRVIYQPTPMQMGIGEAYGLEFVRDSKEKGKRFIPNYVCIN